MRWTMLIVILAGMVGNIPAQNAPAQWEKRYYQRDVRQQQFDREKWKRISDDLNYAKKGEGKEEKVHEHENMEGGGEEIDRTSSPQGLTFPGAQYLFYGLGIIAIGLILYYLVFKNLNRTGRKVGKKKLTLEDVEEDLEKADVDPLLSEAVKNGNYKLAVRLYYLKCIQQLAARNFIRWERDKTNGEYLRELQNPALQPEFRYLTRQFEQTWYGEYEVDQRKFQNLQQKFMAFLKLIDDHKSRAA